MADKRNYDELSPEERHAVDSYEERVNPLHLPAWMITGGERREEWARNNPVLAGLAFGAGMVVFFGLPIVLLASVGTAISAGFLLWMFSTCAVLFSRGMVADEIAPPNPRLEKAAQILSWVAIALLLMSSSRVVSSVAIGMLILCAVVVNVAIYRQFR